MARTPASPDSWALTNALQTVCDRLAPSRHRLPFISLNDLTKRLGVRDVVYSATRMHGYTDWTERGPVIRLAISKTEGRRRMTLAHECAHLLLNPLLDPDTLDVSSGVAQALRHQSNQLLDAQGDIIHRAGERIGIERLCDLIAFELLLPRARARMTQVPDAGALFSLATEQHVSATLLVHQLNSAGHNLRFARTARLPSGGWMIVDVAGPTGPWRTAALLDERSSSVIESLRAQDDAHMEVVLDLAEPSPASAWTASVVRRRQSAFALTGRGTASP